MAEHALRSSEQWFQSAVRYLARFDRTAAQVERYLCMKGATASQIRHTISRLSALNYLDDLAYAERWIEARLNRRPAGRERLKAELLVRGVSESCVDDALSKVLEGIDEEMLARRALERATRGGRTLTPAQASRLLRQWGFEDDVVQHIIEKQHHSERPHP